MNEAATPRLSSSSVTRRGSAFLERPAVIIILLALVGLWPAVLNGGPLWMPDTPSYLRAADSAGAKLFGTATDWSVEYQKLYSGASEAPGNAAAAAMPSLGGAAEGIPVTLKGRSIYYGVVLYAADLAGSLWLVVLLQAVLAAVCIHLTLKALWHAGRSRDRAPPVLLVGLVIALVTPLGFFAGYLMPDIFAGFALLAMMNLLFLWPQQSRGARLFFLALLAFAVLSHNAILTLAVLLLAAVLLFRLLLRQPIGQSAILGVAGCIAVGLAGQAAFDTAVHRLTGAPPVRPPFIAMRLIADGPGLAYLDEHCDERPFLYCRVNRSAAAHSDTLLWSLDPQLSLFRGLSYSEQRRSAAEQNRFVLAVLAERPAAVIEALARDSVEQLFQFDLVAFNYSQGNLERYASAVPARLQEEIAQTRAFSRTLPVRPTEIATAALTFVSVVVLVLFLVRYRKDPTLGQLRGAILFILLAVALNAAISGALSGPKGRYQMRLIWIVPLIAAAALPGISRPAAPAH